MVAGYVLTQGIVIAGVGPLSACRSSPCCWPSRSASLLGWLNGWLVAKAGVAPFIATLGTLYIARGAALLLSNGKTFPNLAGQAARGNTGFPLFGQSFLLGIPTAGLDHARALRRCRARRGEDPVRPARLRRGRQRARSAAGGNSRAAGEDLRRISHPSFCAALVGLIIASQLEAAHPATGESFELNAIAAVVLGGTSLMGGRGSITGSLIGAFVIGVLSDGLVMLGVSEFWQMVIKGAVIVLAVAVDQLQSRLQARFLPYLQRASAEAASR